MRFYFACLKGRLQPIQNKKNLEKVRKLNPQNIFVSYWEVMSVNPRLLIDTRAAFPDARIIIDSGAHTFFGMTDLGSSTGKTNKNKKVNPEIYYRDFLEWLHKNSSLYDYFVELDISEIMGLDFVLRWRNIIAKHGLWGRCIQAWHTDMTFEHWEAMVGSSMDGSRYVAMQGLRGNTDMIPYNKFIKLAYQNEVRVHGFAFTSQYTCDFAFSSVDSTTWMCTAEYGTILVLDGCRVRQVHPQYGQEKFLKLAPRFAAQNNLSRDESQLDGSLISNMEKMIELERRVTDVWIARGVDWESIEKKYPSPRKEKTGESVA